MTITNSVEQVRTFFRQDLPNRTAFIRHPLEQQSEYVQDLYVTMLATIVQYENSPLEEQLLFMKRILAGINSGKDVQYYMQKALVIDANFAKEFYTELASNQIVHNFVVDALVLSNMQASNNAKQLQLLADITEAFQTNENTLAALSHFAASVLTMNPNAELWTDEIDINDFQYYYIYMGLIDKDFKERLTIEGLMESLNTMIQLQEKSSSTKFKDLDKQVKKMLVKAFFEFDTTKQELLNIENKDVLRIKINNVMDNYMNKTGYTFIKKVVAALQEVSPEENDNETGIKINVLIQKFERMSVYETVEKISKAFVTDFVEIVALINVDAYDELETFEEFINIGSQVSSNIKDGLYKYLMDNIFKVRLMEDIKLSFEDFMEIVFKEIRAIGKVPANLFISSRDPMYKYAAEWSNDGVIRYLKKRNHITEFQKTFDINSITASKGMKWN